VIIVNQIQRYRASSLCVIRKDDTILLEQFPEEDGIITFRPIGGTIEYGEDSKSAVIREVKEEINQDIMDTKLLAIVENIFDYYTEVGHEFDFIYEARFLNGNAYEQDVIQGIEGERHFSVVWKRLADFKNNLEFKLVPDGLYEILSSEGETKTVNNIKHVNTKDIPNF
jgi:ADP-ribose pyrophosphatase YjhB (NUDIX family)